MKRYTLLKISFWGIIAMGLITGCCGPTYDYNCEKSSNSSISQLRQAERVLGTDQEDLWIYHRIVEEPYSLNLSFDGYIVGVEKAPKEKITNKNAEDIFYKEYLKNIDANLIGNNEKCSHLGEELKKGAQIEDGLPSDSKRHFISHIFSYFPNDTKKKQENTSALQNINVQQFYNVYQSIIASPEKYTEKTGFPNAFSEGLAALDKLHKEISTKIKEKSYSHIFFFSMGWHTDQQESFRNFNSLFGKILEQAINKGKNDFRPLFIGLTWPSTWDKKLIPPFDSLQKAFSYFNKSDDADEIGSTVASYLLNRVVLPLKNIDNNLKVVVIGHSFGVRLTSSALFLEKLLPANIDVTT